MMGSGNGLVVRAAKAMHVVWHADCADRKCDYTQEDAELLEGLARVALDAFQKEQDGEVHDG